MKRGVPAAGLEFYELLNADDDFCRELGRAMLAAGRLESALVKYLSTHTTTASPRAATLGKLIALSKQHSLLTKMIPALEMLKDQRNYLAHNLHGLFSGMIEETILERTNLLDSDVDLFTERAWQLQRNLNALAEIIADETYA